MKYVVEETEQVFYDIDDVIDACIDRDYHDKYDDYFEEWVNECYSGCEIAGHYYSAYDILHAFDNLDDLEEDYIESETERDIEDARYNLEHTRIGGNVYIQDKTVNIEEDDEEEYEDDEDDSVDCIEATRKFYDEQAETMKLKQAADAENENDLMSMFQHIGA